MNDKTQKRIEGYFDKLTEFINKLPLSDKGRNYLWMDSFCQFYDEPVQSECGKNTYGIQTEWQLQRFIEQFKIRLTDIRVKSIEVYTDKLNRVEPSEAVANIDKKLYKLRQKELIAEIGGDNMSDWESWSVKYLSHQLDHQQKRPSIKLPKQKKRTTYQWQGNADKELPELYSLMINKYNLIASETTIEQFTAIFTGQSIDNIKPIKWHQENASELLYFIIKLEQSNNIVHNPKRADYQKMKACFVKPDGQKFENKLKSLKTNIEIELSPDKQKAIDELMINF